MFPKIRTLLVNDSFHTLDVMGKILQSDPSMTVIGTARNGIEALRQIDHLSPDVVVLDLTMPYMDGPSTLRAIMQKKPIPVLICAPDDAKQQALALSCLSMGAVDAVIFDETIDPMTLDAHLATLPTRIKMVSHIKPIRSIKTLVGVKIEAPSESRFERTGRKARSVLTIGASTGGPSALKFILSRLPENLVPAILIAQHMPENMTNEFVKMLASSSTLQVTQGRHGMPVEPGMAYVAPGGKNMVVNDERIIELRNSDTFEYVPSVDAMMTTAADSFRHKTIGLVLTGMGSDGKNGIVSIKNCGGKTLAQDKETSVVFGMPKEAASTGTIDHVLPLEQIPLKLSRMMGIEENVA